MHIRIARENIHLNKNMAARPQAKKSRPSFACKLCDLTFDYTSKYKRHLDSVSHKRFASIFEESDQNDPMPMVTGVTEDGLDVLMFHKRIPGWLFIS